MLGTTERFTLLIEIYVIYLIVNYVCKTLDTHFNTDHYLTCTMLFRCRQCHIFTRTNMTPGF